MGPVAKRRPAHRERCDAAKHVPDGVLHLRHVGGVDELLHEGHVGEVTVVEVEAVGWRREAGR